MFAIEAVPAVCDAVVALSAKEAVAREDKAFALPATDAVWANTDTEEESTVANTEP